MENNLEKTIISGKFDRLPMSLRLPFQRLVFQKLGIENDVERVLKDGKIISDFIDNTDHAEVRELIQDKKFAEAADILITEIKKEEGENQQRAA